ncbi:hypothetical protein [Oricola nitratireducens]|uniref:hypothetical protein n=1 Tax=Oricola nitratireducens TaxID=2775868 RepID=UPI0018678BBE|nr:hypothetical protein [Oricola nitratireducens]
MPNERLLPSEIIAINDFLRSQLVELKREGFIVKTVYATPNITPAIYGGERFVRDALRYFADNPNDKFFVMEINHEELRRVRRLRLIGSVDHPPKHAYNSSMEILINPPGSHKLIFLREYFHTEKRLHLKWGGAPIPACLLAPNMVIPCEITDDPDALQIWAADQVKRWHDGMGRGYSSFQTIHTNLPVTAGVI